MDIDSIVNLIEQHTGKPVRRCGTGFRALCPAHGGMNHNLFVSQDNEKTWFHCHSNGCHPEDICQSLGIELSDLFFQKIEKQKPVVIDEQAEMTLKEVVEIIQGQSYREKYIVTDYLNNRGLDRELPDDIGYLKDDYGREIMACIIRNKDNLIAGYHRIFLTRNQYHHVVKSGKKMIGKNTHDGAIKGCHIEVQKGANRKLVIAEGVETAFAVSQLINDDSANVWATISAGGMENLQIPDYFTQVIICTDGDEVGISSGMKLKNRLGDIASIVIPPGYEQNPKKDWLDYLVEVTCEVA